MYLAPLNYDRYFKKVFSDLKIAKRFLEDFLDIEIQEIESLKTANKLTDDAQTVEFDFRCKVNDSYIIIEMQQWYKPDVIQRFYVYHALNAALQLEHMPKKVIPLSDGKTRLVHDYSELLPTITIIWMVHDTIKYTDDYISFILTPEYLTEFIKDADEWKPENYQTLLEKRNRLYAMLQTTSKDTEFLSKNRLIYAFQKNIVKNRLYKKYYAWFELAEKTLRKISEKFEYDIYLKDDILSEVVRRLKSNLTEKDSEGYIKDYEEYLEGVRRYDYGIEKKVKQEFEDKLKEEKQLRKIVEIEKAEAQQREAEAQQREAEKEEKLKKGIRKLFLKGLEIEDIADSFEVEIAYVQMVITEK